MKKVYTTVKIFILLLLLSTNVLTQSNTVKINIDAGTIKNPMIPVWNYFGYDEPNYTYMQDGQKLLTEISHLSPYPIYIRTHNLLTTAEGTPSLKWGFTDAYKEDQSGNPIYDWTVMDSIFDSYVNRGLRPLVEIGFMPKALSINPEPYQHSWEMKGPLWTGWTYPPKDYNKWKDLVGEWVKHSIERYGRQEVSSWLWEVWNEPDIGYWSGSFEEYLKLYDYSVEAIKSACPECSVGGPHTTNPNGKTANKFFRGFIEHCLYGTNYATGEKGTPLEFVAFHAKGNPQLIDGHIQMNMGTQLEAIEEGFKAVNSFPEIKNIPIIIGECDPEGCAACSEEREPRYGYRNGTMYPSYTAASFAKIYELMDEYEVNLKGVLTWAFEFENQPWFAGFRDLATNGINKPILNVFRMLGMMDGKFINVNSSAGHTAKEVIKNNVRNSPDVNALAAQSEKAISIMIWNYHDDDLPSNPSLIDLSIEGIEKDKIQLNHYRVDNKYSNSFEAWKEMGGPQNPTPEQYTELEKAGQLQMCEAPKWLITENNKLMLSFSLPRQAVSFLRLTWE